MKVYARPGTNGYTLDLTGTPECPEGFVEMSGERPGLNFIAMDDGEWAETQAKDGDTAESRG